MRPIDLSATQSRIVAFIAERRLGLGLIVISIVVCLRLLGFLQVLELLTLDRLQHISFAEPTDSRITLIGIDRNYIERQEAAALEYQGLASLIENVLSAEPAVIGIDIVEDDLTGSGRDRLLSLLESNQQLVTVDKVLPPTIPPFKGLSKTVLSNQVGFNDFSADDSQVRRMFLGWSPTQPADDSFRESFALLLAQKYLSTSGIELDNGIQDTETMRFGEVEIPRLHPSSGGYQQEELIYGVQTLINYRGGRIGMNEDIQPFRVVLASEIADSGINRQDIENKIVIFGIIDSSIADEFDSVLPEELNYNGSLRMTGLELQAHATSQLTSAVIKERPLFHAWSDPLEYVFIIAFGLIGISIKKLSKSTARGLVWLGTISLLLCVFSYWALGSLGLWLPLVPAMLALIVNGIAYIAVSQSERRWRTLVQERDLALEALKLERQKTIEHAFDTIHNGPLQTLANLLRLIRDDHITIQDAGRELEKLNQEIREVGDDLKQDSISDDNVRIKVGKSSLSLDMPLHELFYEIYRETLERPFPGFETLKIQARSLEPVEPENLTIECKRKLCHFFEETLCNVGKHAIGATKLTVTGKTIDNFYILRIVDNGLGFPDQKAPRKGRGTKISRELSTILKGNFIRRNNYPKGIFCEFKWTLN